MNNILIIYVNVYIYAMLNIKVYCWLLEKIRRTNNTSVFVCLNTHDCFPIFILFFRIVA